MKCKLNPLYLITLIGVLFVTAFILSNSFKSFDVSKGLSDSITDIVISGTDASREAVELFVRKSAHFIEFAILGALIMCLRNHIVSKWRRDFIGFACFLALAIAVADEHIQSFSDRTSSTSDIILDFIGALTGFFTVWIITKIYNTVKQKTKEHN